MVRLKTLRNSCVIERRLRGEGTRGLMSRYVITNARSWTRTKTKGTPSLLMTASRGEARTRCMGVSGEAGNSVRVA
eukprot:scaffold16107_cov67-Phaeocystis_antarctica.AAC.11